MNQSLALSSTFIPICPDNYSSEEWGQRVRRDLETLSSLAAIESRQKYYFDEKEDKIVKSSWMISEVFRAYLGNWAADYLASCEEAIYRKLWRLSVNDTIEGILHAKQKILRTLAIASRSLESADNKITADIQELEKQIMALRDHIGQANTGLLKLNDTYSQTAEKHTLFKPAVDDFYQELNEFALKVLSQISESKETKNSVPEADNLSTHTGSLLAPPNGKEEPSFEKPSIASNLPPPLALPTPFANPKTSDQREFNEGLRNNFHIMNEYLEKHSASILEEMKIANKYHVVKGRSKAMPWSISATTEGRMYFHYHVSIVPKGEGGSFKKDKRGYGISHGRDIAKLSTKLYTEKNLQFALREAKYLKLCSEKKMPNVVKTHDVIWVTKKTGVCKQIIYQDYCVNGNLQDSLARLSKVPEKIKKIIVGMMRGLAALHSENIVHRDIKPTNIFLDEKDEPHIGDFGFACQQDETCPLALTPLYADPDILNTQETGKQHNDIWSLGMMMYALLTKPTEKTPWPWLKAARRCSQVIRLNLKQKDTEFPEPPVEDKWMHACWEMLQLDPTKRPTAQELLERFEPQGETRQSDA